MLCPNCGKEMTSGFAIVRSSVFWCESRDTLSKLIGDEHDSLSEKREGVVHTILGNKGSQVERGWPKPASFCMEQGCLSVLLRLG